MEGLRLVIAALACVTVVTLAAAGPASAYDIVVFGRDQPIEVTAIARIGDSYRLLLPDSAGEIPATTELHSRDIDFYSTYVRNLEAGAGNVVVFVNGRYLRFDKVRIESGRATIDVDGGGSFTVAEGLIDFEASVLEGALVQLPKSAAQDVSVAKSRPELGKNDAKSRRNSASERAKRLRDMRNRRSRTGTGAGSRGSGEGNQTQSGS